ncbi:MAG: hypothetical protein LBF68_01770 [Christensenellaceae bacterium]|nr:hypothetical protein [Christensenellaceae bacterium]
MTYKIEAVNFRNFDKGLKKKDKRLNAKKQIIKGNKHRKRGKSSVKCARKL